MGSARADSRCSGATTALLATTLCVLLATLLVTAALSGAVAAASAASAAPTAAASPSAVASPAAAGASPAAPAASPTAAAASTTAGASSVAPSTAAAAPAAAPAQDATTPERCRPYANATVLATAPGAGSYGPNDTVTVHRGSELVVTLCGDDRRLEVGDREWLEPVSASRDEARVRVVAAPTDDARVSLGELARPEPIRGPTLAVVDYRVQTDLVEGPLVVRSAEERSAVAATVERYRDREAALASALDALDGATAAIEDGEPADGAALNETVRAHAAYRGAVADLRADLYALADSYAASGQSADALLALAAAEASVAEETGERVDAYDEALVERERSLTWAVRQRVHGGVLAGLLAGIALGAALPLYRGVVARRQLDRGEWATYSRRTAAIPTVLGAVVLLVALGWLALEVGWQLLEVVP